MKRQQSGPIEWAHRQTRFARVTPRTAVLAMLLACSPGCRVQPDDPRTSALKVIGDLKAKDWESLAQQVHPTKGLLLSPYGFVDLEHHIVLSAQEVRHLTADTTVRRWGFYDGTGDPIDLAFDEYYDRFIYDADFVEMRCGQLNEQLGHGNSINNISTAFPNSVFVECHYGGSERYDGMDWRSLRIVLELDRSRWRAVAIVHDEWTI